MQVLLKNPYAGIDLKDLDVFPSFWSEDCLFMGPRFSMSSLMQVSDPVGLSPYLILNSQIAFLLSLLEQRTTTLAHNLGPLGTVGAYLFTKNSMIYREDESKIKKYLGEYVPKDQGMPAVQTLPDQMIIFGENTIRQSLWEKLAVGGVFILGVSKQKITIDPTFKFEALGKLYPSGEATEFGWRFDDENIGMEEFEVVKLKKLA